MPRGSGGETTRGKCFQVILTRRLDVVSEQAAHDDRVCATFIPLDDGVLTSIMLSGNGRVGVNDGWKRAISTGGFGYAGLFNIPS